MKDIKIYIHIHCRILGESIHNVHAMLLLMGVLVTYPRVKGDVNHACARQPLGELGVMVLHIIC